VLPELHDCAALQLCSNFVPLKTVEAGGIAKVQENMLRMAGLHAVSLSIGMLPRGTFEAMWESLAHIRLLQAVKLSNDSAAHHRAPAVSGAIVSLPNLAGCVRWRCAICV
jgi:hypothetical protein